MVENEHSRSQEAVDAPTTASTTAHAPQSSRRTASLLERWRRFGRHPRLMGVDAARGIAMLGMLGAHLGLGAAGFDWAVPETWGDLMNGRPAVLFAVIAGVSLSLMTRDLDPDDADAVRIARLRLVGRGLAVFVIGVVLELLLTPIAVILAVYGLLFVIAAPMLTWRTRSLVIGAVAMAVVAPLLVGAVEVVTTGLDIGGGVSFALTGTYPIPVWIVFLLLGLVIGRMPLERLRTQLIVLTLGAVLSVAGYGVAALASSSVDTASSPASTKESSSVSASMTGPASDFDLEGLDCQSVDGLVVCADPDRFAPPEATDVLASLATHWLDDGAHSGGAMEIIGSGGLAIAILAIMLLLARPLRWLLIPLAALGSMPLTAYVVHVLLFVGGVITLLASPWALWFVISAAFLVLATVWALTRGRGPLEGLTARCGQAFSRQPRERRPRRARRRVPGSRPDGQSR